MKPLSSLSVGSAIDVRDEIDVGLEGRKSADSGPCKSLGEDDRQRLARAFNPPAAASSVTPDQNERDGREAG